MNDNTAVPANAVSSAGSSCPQIEVEGQSEILPNNDESNVDECEVNGTEQHGNESAATDPFQPKETDEEGLSLEYDVAICGTGLVQSILASALARAGKSVLHCDGADYYGELDTVWTSPMVEDLLKSKNKIDETGDKISEKVESCADAGDSIPLETDGGRCSLRWHHTYCSSSLSSKSGTFRSGIRIGTSVKTPYGDGIVRSIRWPSHKDNDNEDTGTQRSSSQITVEIELDKWNLADGRSPLLYATCDTSSFTETKKTGNTYETSSFDPLMLEDVLCRSRNIRSIRSIQTETILKQSERSLALDATPSFVLAAGRAVQGMLASGVADYLEFKTIDGLYWLEKIKPTVSKTRNKKITKPEKKSEGNEGDDAFSLYRVPCSKNDVFGTKLLAPMEKRRFMKFIQLSMDYATKMSVAEEIRQENGDGGNHREDTEIESEEEVHSLNERHLNQGRSLARPQNKAVNKSELQMLEEAMEIESMTFDEFLSQKYKLSPKLRSIVRYALAWEIGDSSTSLGKGMATLRKHLQALGRYGTTAFLVPLYGSGELSQAFCRSAAVFGATYLLRRAPLTIEVENADNEGDPDTNVGISGSKKGRVKGIVLSNDDMLVDDHEHNKEDLQQQPKHTTKSIKCSHTVLPVNALGDKYFRRNDRIANGMRMRIMRRISIFSGKIIQSDTEEQRHIIFIPPQTIGNDHAIHGVLLDSSACVAPRGCTVLHLTTTILEKSGCSDKNEEGKNIDAAEILKYAQAAVLKSKQASVKSDDPAIEIYHVSFSHGCRDLDEARKACNYTGIHLCNHTGQVLTADSAFEQAEKIFHSICPGDKFLGLSSEIDKVIRERVEEKRYDDDEKNMLESAIDMIEQSPDTSPISSN